MALRNMLVRVGADISGLKKGMAEANGALSKFSRNMEKTMGGLRGMMLGGLAGIGAGALTVSAVEDAMKYEALMTTLGESLGNSRKDFEKWSETTGNAMGFSRLQSAELANTLSLNFKKIAVDQADLTAKTTKMMEIAGIVSNKRGMLMSEVSDRIRSAMNQEADGADELGVNVRIAAIKQSDAYKMMADNRPWDQLNQNMQKSILYSHIIQQVTENLGSTIQDTTQLRMSQFTAGLQDVKLALGQAFLPIIYQVLPYLTKLTQAIYRALQWVYALSKALFGGFKFDTKTTQQQTDATQKQAGAMGELGDATEKAGKKAKKAAKEAKRGVAGFDEVNLLSDAAKAAGAAGGAGAGAGAAAMPADQPFVPAPPDPSAFLDTVDHMAERVLEFIGPVKKALTTAWEYISSYLQIKFHSLRGIWKREGGQVTKAFKNIWKAVKPIISFLVKFVWESFKGLVDGIIQFFEGFIQFFAGVFTGDWKKAWEGIKNMAIGGFKAVLNFLNFTLLGGIRKIFLNIAESGIKAFSGLVTSAKGSWDDLWSGLKGTSLGFLDEAISGIKGKFDDLVTTIYVIGDDILKAITGSFKDLGTWLKTNVIDKMVSVFVNGRTGIANKASEIYTAVKGKFTGAYDWFRDNVARKMYDVFVNWKNNIAGKAADIWDATKAKFSGVYDWFKRTVINPIVRAFNDIKAGFSAGLGSGVKAIINTGIKAINSIIGIMNKVLDAVDKVTPGKIPSIPKIPQLAKGGIATRATMAIVGEGAGPEAIAPIDKLQGYVTNAVLSALRFMDVGGGGGGATGDIVLNLDGRTFARLIKPHLDKETQRIGGNVKFNQI